MITKLSDFNMENCEKLDAHLINAYLDLQLDPEKDTGIVLDHSWGINKLDLLPIVKAGETITSLELAMKPTPTYLQFNREDGGADCIHGDDLSRIISMQLLKDVDQTHKPKDGDIYMFKDGKFHTFNLQKWMDDIEATLVKHLGRIENHENRILIIEETLTPPANLPHGSRLAWGNINDYGDYTNTNRTDHGIYTHDRYSPRPNDQYFA